MSRLVSWAALVAVLATLVSSSAVRGAPCWEPPVVGDIVDPFRRPPCAYCAGNRGLEYRVRPGSPVTAVATGTVMFSGSVAGIGYVVVRHGDGRRATYGRLRTFSVDRGQRVAAGRVIGTASQRFHFGLRDGEHYVDPTPLLGEWRTRPRLVPIDGRPAWPAPSPRLRCGP